MTKREFSVLISRAMSLILLFQAVTRIELIVAGVLQLFDDLGEHRTTAVGISVFLASLLPFVGILAMSVFMWQRAWMVAGWMTGGMPNPDDAAFRGDGAALERAAFVAIGLWLLTDAVPRLGMAAWEFVAVRHTPMERAIINPPWQASVTAYCVEAGMGFLLVLLPDAMVGLTHLVAGSTGIVRAPKTRLADAGDGPMPG